MVRKLFKNAVTLHLTLLCCSGSFAATIAGSHLSQQSSLPKSKAASFQAAALDSMQTGD